MWLILKLNISFYRADGRATINTTVPDTITSWVASAFAVNSQTGLGVSPTSAKVTNEPLLQCNWGQHNVHSYADSFSVKMGS